ncbi:OmpA family protein [Thiohalospira sp.]|uniref:OmpA family protein n=1 Tax=Thiohalospira sp. TaxID=3080549 RepID=UPI00397F7ECA
MRLIATILPGLLFSLAMTTASAEGVRDFRASLNEARWSVSGDRMSCRLTQRIPDFGRAVFTAGAGNRIHLTFEMDRDPSPRAVRARLQVVAPPWRSEPDRPLDRTTVRANDRNLVVFSGEPARRALHALEEGLYPTLSYASMDRRHRVAVSAVNLASRLEDFHTCTASLHPDSFEDVQNLRVRFGVDEHRLDAEARATLDRLLAYWEVDPTAEFAVLGGYSDRGGDSDYNEELAQLRVDAVHEYLVENGFPDERIVDLVWGEERPDTSGDARSRDSGRRVEIQGPQTRAEQRRVEIKLRREE